MTSSRWIVAAGVTLALSTAGCINMGDHRAPPDQFLKRADGSSVTTTLDEFVRIVRAGEKYDSYAVLVGAYGPSFPGGTFGASVGRAVFDAHDSPTGVASFQLNSGWAYVIRPPRWPIVRTPRQRGGVTINSATDAVTLHVLAYADGLTERIVLLGAFDANNNPVQTVNFTVDANPPHTSVPPLQNLAVGEYAEVTLDPATLDWSDIKKGPHPVTSPQSPQELRDLVKYVRLRAANAGMAWNTGLNIP
jgi:hypothetical protein